MRGAFFYHCVLTHIHLYTQTEIAARHSQPVIVILFSASDRLSIARGAIEFRGSILVGAATSVGAITSVGATVFFHARVLPFIFPLNVGGCFFGLRKKPSHPQVKQPSLDHFCVGQLLFLFHRQGSSALICWPRKRNFRVLSFFGFNFWSGFFLVAAGEKWFWWMFTGQSAVFRNPCQRAPPCHWSHRPLSGKTVG